MKETNVPDNGIGEQVIEADDGTEVAVHIGVLFKKGRVALSAHDSNGTGTTAYLDPLDALAVADRLIQAAREAEAN